MNAEYETAVPLELLWAKSNSGGRSHSLPGHLLDAIAVAELIWDQFMAPRVRDELDTCCGGRGRDVFRLLAGWHDVGKATPPFQMKQRELADVLEREAGLTGWPEQGSPAESWHHTHATRAILKSHLTQSGACDRWSWVPILLEGHHGMFRTYGDAMRRNQPPSGGLGDDRWQRTQTRLCTWIEEEVGLRLADVQGHTPTRAMQLALAGFVVMADWIASCDILCGLGQELADVSLARQRAHYVWNELGLRGGWTLGNTAPVPFAERFGFEPRPLQSTVIAMAEAMEQPGLMLVEAPMGEGKTEAALAAVEILARRFGCDGFVFAMPTQGTTDAMYERCERWAHQVDPDFPLALVHGKAMMNEDWRQRLAQAHRAPDIVNVHGDEFDLPDQYGSGSGPVAQDLTAGVPADWLLAKKRALLSPGVVMTIDHLLLAAAKIRFVMLRHAGLVGKVVVIDEVHSYDIFMETFLDEVLHWLGEAGVPVIIMSATLPPDQRARLMISYGGSATVAAEFGQPGYPIVRQQMHGFPVTTSTGLPSWRDSLAVEVKTLGQASLGVEPIAKRIGTDMADGGCALAIMNTVGRAQNLARVLRATGQPVLLIHGLLTSVERARRTEQALDLLGKDRSRQTGRPSSLVIVATQVAEQSFDVDADILFTDLAPMDLLLQRIGRLHRHARPDVDRPERLRQPRVVVTGVDLDVQACLFPDEFGLIDQRKQRLKGVYDPWALIRTAGALLGATSWQVPADVPALVEGAYSKQCTWTPSGWQEREADAKRLSHATSASRASHAGSYLLGVNPWGASLEDLHYLAATTPSDETVVVRDGEPTLEISLVVWDGERFFLLDGTPLGPNGEQVIDPEVARLVLGDSVRVRDQGGFRGLRPKPEWSDVSWLRSQPVLVLDTDLRATLSDCVVQYDREYGLAIEWTVSSR